MTMENGQEQLRRGGLEFAVLLTLKERGQRRESNPTGPSRSY